jgi:hypothetical protein
MKLVIEPDAAEELEQAAARYEQALPGLGTDFLTEMRARIRDVQAGPLGFPVFSGRRARDAFAAWRRG